MKRCMGIGHTESSVYDNGVGIFASKLSIRGVFTVYPILYGSAHSCHNRKCKFELPTLLAAHYWL